MGTDLCSFVLDTIRRNNGKILENALIDALKNRGLSINQREVRRVLLKLEVTGYIRVTSLDEERKIIELINSKELSS